MPIPELLKAYLPPDFPEDSKRSAVSNALKKRFLEFRKRHGSQKIPVPVENLGIGDLHITVRTFHVLSRKGIKTLREVGQLTFNDLITARNFGITSLVDLLFAIDSVIASDIPRTTSEKIRADFAIQTEYLTQMDIDWLVLEKRIRFPSALRKKILPALPVGFEVNTLHLNSRTRNRLQQLEINKRPESLSNFTVGDFLKIDGLGKKAVLEFLIRLRPYCSNHSEERSLEKFKELKEIAKKFESIPCMRLTNRDLRFGLLFQKAIPRFSSLHDFISDVLVRESGMASKDEVDALQELFNELLAATRLTFEQECSSVIRTITDSRNVDIVFERYGFFHGQASTFEEAGKKFGISRQRVEQICSRVELRLEVDNFLPVLDKTLEVVRDSIPDIAANIEEILQTNGLTGRGVSVKSVVAFAKLLNRDLGFEVTKIGGGDLIEAEPGSTNAKLVLRVARKAISKWGAVRYSQILDQFASDQVLSQAIILEAITGQEGFSWLDDEHEWFWFGNRRANRVLRCMSKVWSVTPKIQLADLRESLRRHHRMQGSALPQAIVAEVCRQDPELVIEGDMVSRKSGVLVPDSLSDIERKMVHVLKQLGSIASREEFELQCLDAGIVRETFYMYIDNSPVFKKFARGVYGLVGRSASLHEINALCPDYNRNHVLNDFGWNGPNQVWVTYRLSKNVLNTGLLSVPAPMTNLINGVFRFNDRSLSIWSKGSFSLGSYFRLNGYYADDIVLCTFDLKNRDLFVKLDGS